MELLIWQKPSFYLQGHRDTTPGKTVTDDGRNGGLTQETAYNGKINVQNLTSNKFAVYFYKPIRS